MLLHTESIKETNHRNFSSSKMQFKLNPLVTYKNYWMQIFFTADIMQISA